jgi:Tfp pilus assembly protein PilE
MKQMDIMHKLISKKVNLHPSRDSHAFGFTAVELLVTLFVAAAFLIAGYQLYGLVIKDGGETRAQSRVSNVAYDYLQRYKSTVTNPCIANTPLSNQPITITGVSSATISVTISCPYTSNTSLSKVVVTVSYNNPQQVVTDATLSTPVSSQNCPTGFILVPGSPTYGTNNFCVMKYEAKQVGSSNVPISQAAGLPWVNISQITATAVSPSVVGCTGCHLITEAEWMTIAQNVLSVPSNWSGGVVGNGYIYSGHNDSAPSNTLSVPTNDSDGYNGTGNFAGDTGITNSMVGNTQKRTLTLTNGQVIWDFSGNVWEWTSGTSTNNQPGIAGNVYGSWIEWPNVTTNGSLAVNPFPSGTGISGASSWTSANGIGMLISNPAETALHGFFRGGSWGSGGTAGVLTLYLINAPSYTLANIGFRVTSNTN